MTWVHRRCVIDGISFLCILGLDRIAKYLALDLLSPGVPDQIGSFFGINLFWTLTYNQGAAWGMFSEFPQLLLVSRFLFIGLLSVIYVRSGDALLFRTALVIVLAGACGNIIDMMMFGHVVDMIHVEFWGWDYPVFNIADMAICTGAAAMVTMMYGFKK